MSILENQEKLLNDVGYNYIPSSGKIQYHGLSRQACKSNADPHGLFTEPKTYREKLTFLTPTRIREMTKIWFDSQFHILLSWIFQRGSYKYIFIGIPDEIACRSFSFPPDILSLGKWLIEEHQLFVALFYNSIHLKNACLVISLEPISIDKLSTELNNQLANFLQTSAIACYDPDGSKRAKGLSEQEVMQMVRKLITEQYHLDPNCPIQFSKLFQEIKTDEEEEFEQFNKSSTPPTNKN